MLGIQIFGILFGLGLIYLTFLYYKRKEFSVSELVFWMMFALLFISISLFPSILDPIVETFDFARTFDFLVVVGFMVIVGLVFYMFSVVQRTQKKVENLVRTLAIERRKKPKR
ncbi:MAG: DUF2304 domain-containing protein [archaeon]